MVNTAVVPRVYGRTADLFDSLLEQPDLRKPEHCHLLSWSLSYFMLWMTSVYRSGVVSSLAYQTQTHFEAVMAHVNGF